MYLLDNQQQKASAASASLRETHYFEHSLWKTLVAEGCTHLRPADTSARTEGKVVLLLEGRCFADS